MVILMINELHISVIVGVEFVSAAQERAVSAEADDNIFTKKWLLIFQIWILSKIVRSLFEQVNFINK